MEVVKTIVDAMSSGLTLCPKCNYHAVNERGWCYNGCNREGISTPLSKEMPIVVENKIKVRHAFNESCTSDKKFFGVRIGYDVHYFIIEED